MKNKTITFKISGRTDYMGFTWFSTFVNGIPLMDKGVHVKFHALNKTHAREMYNQTY